MNAQELETKSAQVWCSKCGDKYRTTHARRGLEKDTTWRRKKCLSCGNKISTVEYTLGSEPPEAMDLEQLEQVKVTIKAAERKLKRSNNKRSESHDQSIPDNGV